ncbi:MAG: BamA/TamA family outer membrane protein [Gammaproteobacteria bacterium]|nr:BamA/TamA family outer membrane protein [Gammaproteobacteria bacterium]
MNFTAVIIRGRVRGFSLLWLLLFPLSTVFSAEGEGVLDDVRFSGNKVTRETVLRQEIVVREGEPWTTEQVEQSRQAIMNLGLFKSVRAELLEEEGRNILQFTVVERFYILPIPLLSYRPDFLADETTTNYSYGGQLRLDNLFGLNQRLKIEYEETEYDDDIEPPEKELEISYSYPRVVGTPYRLVMDAEHVEKGIYTREGDAIVASTEFERYAVSLIVSRWLNRKGSSEGWQAGAGLHFANNRYQDTVGVSGYHSNDVVALLGGVGYVMVDKFPYHRKGQEFAYSLELADELLGSDSEYFRNTFRYRRYTPLEAVDANINTQLKLGLAFGDGDAYSLGSSTSLRGYENDTLEGNLLLQGNLEYHHHLSGYRQLRGVLFMDLANVWPAFDEIDNHRLYSSFGVGLRWRMQSFVDVTLRADYAYNTDTGESETYLATSGSF